jgi:hypothetical protein
MPVRRVYADLSELFVGAEELVLDADAAAGASTVTVKSITGAAINNILCFREPGSESSEIIATHASTAPSGNTVTLATTLVESHPRGTTVYIIRANQVRFYTGATEVDANADDASLTALAAAQDIDPTQIRNFYDDTVSTSGFYYWRFSDSVNSVDLTYHGPIPWATFVVQYSQNEVGYVLDFVRRKLGHEWDERFSKQTAIDEINACFRFIQGRLKRWSRYLIPDYVLGQTARGVFDYALPSDIYDNETNKSILQVRIGGVLEPLIPLDEKEFDQLLDEVSRTTVRTQPAVGATTLEIVNSYDFDDSGSVNISTSNTVDAITYTGVTRSATTGVLTGVPATGAGAIGATHAVGLNVWQGESEGQPRYFNARNGRIRIYPLPNSTHVNKNVVADYYEEALAVDDESDTLDTPRYDMVKEWLLWKGKSYWRNNGTDDPKDANFLMFGSILKDAIRTEVSGQKFRMHPAINTINYNPSSRDRRFEVT